MSDCPCHPSPTPRALSRRQMLVGGVAATGALALTALPTGAAGATGTSGAPTAEAGGRGVPRAIHPDHGDGTTRAWSTVHPRNERHVRAIMHPIAGNSTSLDNYRISSRPSHEGVDLMAKQMVPLVACVSGTVVELRHRATPSGSGGNSLYLQGDDGWYYAYLHINNDRPGTDDGSNLVQHAWGPALHQYATNSTTMNEGAARGHRVRKGEVVAYVGDSGNAENAGTHLHFEIRKPAGRLWDAAAVNPQFSLDAAETGRALPAVPPETFLPWDNAPAFVDRQYRDFLGRGPSSADLAYWSDQLDSGTWSPIKLLEHFLLGAECTTQVHAVTRLYRAYFLRNPDRPGFDYWVGRRRAKTSLAWISDYFATSAEFTSRYGHLDDEQFVDRIYQNVLGRSSDLPGRTFWLGRLAQGSSRGWVMVQFSESAEYQAKTRAASMVIGAYGCMLGRMPSAPDLAFWSERPLASLLDGIRLGPEYAARTTG